MINKTKIAILILALACGAVICNAVTIRVNAVAPNDPFNLERFVAPSSTTCSAYAAGPSSTSQVHGPGIDLVAGNGDYVTGSGPAGQYVIFASAAVRPGTAAAWVSW